jgi:NAD dependent epimerase/dehydratase
LSTWSGKRVLVTGGEGFIGSHLSERLAREGAETRVLTLYNFRGSWGWLDGSELRDEIEVLAGDVRDRDSLTRALAGVDVVFHLAALIAIPYSYEAPLSYVRTNVEGTLNVLQGAMAAEAGLVVHTSTSEVYGTALHVPIDESHPLQGQSPYSASKIAADMMAEAFHRSYGLPVTTVRPFNTYGPRQSARAVIPTIITQALSGQRIELGSLHPTRDFTFVEDTVDAFLAAASAPAAVGEVINVGSGAEISIGELAALIEELAAVDADVESVRERMRPPESEVERLLADATKAREVLGWEPQTTLRDGLTRTIDWISENLDHYKVGLYTL